MIEKTFAKQKFMTVFGQKVGLFDIRKDVRRQEYFAEGVTEALITELEKISAVRGDLATIGDAL